MKCWKNKQKKKGIENGPYERELVSQLLLYVLEQKVVTREKIVEGFEDAIMALGNNE